MSLQISQKLRTMIWFQKLSPEDWRPSVLWQLKSVPHCFRLPPIVTSPRPWN